jgi:DNA-binding transcriptional ArsR family regulator
MPDPLERDILNRDILNHVFSALADPSRRHVLGYLADHGTATATELTGELPMSRQAVSNTKTLSDAGPVRRARRRETVTG